MSRLVYGVGLNSSEYPATFNNRMLKEYDLWKSMLLRCTEKYWVKRQSYSGTKCSDNFKNYSFFYEWCNSQVGFKSKDEKGNYWQLDKDILVKGNKTYSEDICVFVPSRINNLFIKGDAVRGEYPVGVCLDKRWGRFAAQCNDSRGKQRHLGYFATPEEAFQAYKKFKEWYIKQVAKEYVGQIDPRTYESLMNYKVMLTD